MDVESGAASGRSWRIKRRPASTREATAYPPSSGTSLIVDPSDGRLPHLADEAQRRQTERQEYRLDHALDSWEDQERCMTYQRAPPVSSGYSNAYHIVQ